MKRKEFKKKGKAVLGSWGITLVATDNQYIANNLKPKFEKEVRRIQKLGYRAGIIDVKIVY